MIQESSKTIHPASSCLDLLRPRFSLWVCVHYNATLHPHLLLQLSTYMVDYLRREETEIL